MREPAARGGRCDGLSRVLTADCKARSAPRFASPSAWDGIQGRKSRQWAGRPIFATGRIQLRPPENMDSAVVVFVHSRTPDMTPTESFPVGLTGLELAWESVGVVLIALALGLVVGFAVRARLRRAAEGATPASRLQERELASLRRIASDLARA